MSKATEPGPEVPVSTMPYPPLHVDKKYVVLSDWLVLFMVRPGNLTVLSPQFPFLNAVADLALLFRPRMSRFYVAC